MLHEQARVRMDKTTHNNQEVKKHVRLQDRRGSSVSLVLDMSSLSNTEPILQVSTPRDVTVQFLNTASHVLTQKMLQEWSCSLEELQEEFAKIPSNFISPEEFNIPGRAAKDRYRSILPNPQSRVCLKSVNFQEEESYINANYIRKCICYWPETEASYGPFTIQVQDICECDDYTIRSFSLQFKDECRTVKHIVFSSWPDQRTPESAKMLLHLIFEVEKILQAAQNSGPIVVHCSAGIGRTGCFIATQIGCQQLKDKGEVDILGIVCQLRIDRGGMIQTSEQYQFIHHTLAMYASQLPEFTDN
ncbi:tyrosine-protein phosphatase non-receptor type 7 isoform X3 [Python bivittatus]|uniref:protein-tyrosine-phosphatase n=1 Tax=Python bivittatus TaxID=176946 RepID=A0A9F5IG89_PYTBI|nr:tyrosine-protein phosphatase non-receptor type 7 isoform X3 [Python bivittatus]